MFFSGEVSGNPGDYCTGETSRRPEGTQPNSEVVVTHDIKYFHQRLLSSVRVTEDSALKRNILEKKRKQEVAASISEVQIIDYEKAKTVAARKVSNIMSSNKEEKIGPCIEIGDEPIQDIELLKTFLLEKKMKQEAAASISKVKIIDYEKAKTMAARIVSDIMLSNKEEKSGPCI